MYNISPIQAGIQCIHSCVEYSLKYPFDANFKEWANEHKTVIILSGGGSNDMVEREKELESFNIQFASFQEPDLNNSISAISFLVGEKIYAYDPEKHGMRSSREVEFETYLKSFKLAAN
jgi:hypothetical protein